MQTEIVKTRIPKQEFDKLNKKITHVLIYARMQKVDDENNEICAIRVDGMFKDTTDDELDEFHQVLVKQGVFENIDKQNMYRWFWKLPEPITASQLNRDEILAKFIDWATAQSERVNA